MRGRERGRKGGREEKGEEIEESGIKKERE